MMRTSVCTPGRVQEYGFLGTFLITGGLMLNALAACPFYQAPPWENKKKPKTARKKDSSEAEVTSGISGDLRRQSAASLEQSQQGGAHDEPLYSRMDEAHEQQNSAANISDEDESLKVASNSRQNSSQLVKEASWFSNHVFAEY
ncbi:uncharacterized protein LOC144119732 [Amblyomma americanum]